MSVRPSMQLPRPWQGRMVWDGRELQSNKDWVFELTENEIQELQEAISSSLASAKPLKDQSYLDFKFDKLSKRLCELSKEINRGRGFTLIRGLSNTNWEDDELTRAYWLIGSFMGAAVPQNARADLLGHVIDLRQDDPTTVRQYQTNAAQPFHSDSCDVVGLLCLRQAKRGGESAIASSATIHNQLLENNPDALHTLYGEFLCDRYGEIPEGKNAYYPVHVFNNIANSLICCGMDPDIRLAPRLAGVSDLTNKQLSALDAFQQTAKETALNMVLQRGDIQLVNNLTVVHARNSFEDHLELEQRRYLLRLWLSLPTGRELPKFLSERWGSIAVGSIRGGIRVPGVQPEVNFNP